ncbi:hypothetical protein HYC85_027429 [Camellia sinensis]|uniref:Uncharacterized protein n=1 Tax=Camellia sinensis TaxID=4442 RepID=A0A7J7G6D3_CAMSI|nr:hypothetical protein HYC85_027429 [Camellia sinensis]
MLYGTECWATKKQHVDKMSVAEMRMLRWMCGKTRQDMIRNECIWEWVGVAPIEDKLRENRLRWFGHIQRRPTEAVVKRCDAVTGRVEKKDSCSRLHLMGLKAWFYEGVIDSFDPVKKKHKVSYTDGDEEILNLRDETWELVSGNSESDGEQAAECQSPDPSSDMYVLHFVDCTKRRKRKQTLNHQLSKERGRVHEVEKLPPANRKELLQNLGRKSKDDTKVDGKLKDNTSKSGAKSKDNSQKSSGKSVVDASKTTGKSKDVNASTPKSSIKFKLDSPRAATKDTPKTTTKDTPKTATKSKGKASKSGNKSNANGSGKAKAGSAKVKETEGKEKSTETVKTPKSAKGKSPDTLKGQETGAKSGKKRRRGGAKS